MPSDFFERHLVVLPAMVILRGHDVKTTLRLCRAAYSQGVALIEVPWHGEESRQSLIAAVDWARPLAGVTVGAGTVISHQVLDSVAEVGATFTVAPGFNAEVAAASVERGLPHLPGVATGTEVGTALAAGFRWQKAFPASVLTPAWVTALHGPFPGVRFVATGGINAGNARSFLDAGARAVSFGSSFTPEALSALRN
ncbi:bifunctional 4-hydroxy-2-oxoglutarate aldolase/2-dehydro-3-deoxy-phosphogluconate aldolase [Lentzea sp. NPDC058436]|uniref:bifunctional 4-hydroxy-2-oxoglutarate aldolase/2-dehydro-3-deoxy-phosphogluconate aldolase n=1 Tax=Lentzea sp. NPDC058436 TaxID=3346499 RepID=UPI003647A839